MSHELRTPLNAVIGFSDVLLDRMFGELNERQEEYMRDIRDSGRHLLELINEILDLSKVEAGRMELERAAVSLPELLAQGVAMVREHADGARDLARARRRARRRQRPRRTSSSSSRSSSTCSRNAVKFTPDGGSVAVTARARRATRRGSSVRDTGIGIAERERERIFEAFQRGGREARDPAREGTGLGLTLSRRIIDLHGGRLWMESELGVGSTFSFTIPVADRGAAGGRSVAEVHEPVPGVAGSVLVVEDDRRSADLLRRLPGGRRIRRLGRRATALEGLELARRLAPRAVILDILLPGLTAGSLLARLKGDPATAAIPVVIVSMLDERGTGFALGAAEYLVKPVDRQATARCARALRLAACERDAPWW